MYDLYDFALIPLLIVFVSLQVLEPVATTVCMTRWFQMENHHYNTQWTCGELFVETVVTSRNFLAKWGSSMSLPEKTTTASVKGLGSSDESSHETYIKNFISHLKTH